MGKLLRGSRKSPDAEQLLTPRKSGFFGKRNNGVRSEDPEKPKALSARRLVTSVFKSSRRNGDDDDDDKSPVDGSPAIQLELFGDNKPRMNGRIMPQDAPSPDLVVLTKNSRRNLNKPPSSQNGSASNKDEETVMSDLTGTVSPHPPGHLASSLNNNSLTNVSNSIAETPPGKHQDGVKFAGTPERPNQAFYSAYSPGLGGFDANNENNNNDIMEGEEMDDEDDNDEATMEEVRAPRNFCKSSMLDQVLGVVDGACHRTMDITLGGQWARQQQQQGANQWGVAPSDDDESTNLDTATFLTNGDTATTCFTKDTPNNCHPPNCFAPSGGSRGTGTGTGTCTGTTSGTGSGSGGSGTTRTATATGPIDPVPEEPAQFDPAVRAAAHSEHQHAPPIPLVRQASDFNEADLHENFELVLGQLPSSRQVEPKKRGWGPRILRSDSRKANNEDALPPRGPSAPGKRPDAPAYLPPRTPTNVKPVSKMATPATAPETPRTPTTATGLSKQEQREALYQSVLERESRRDAPDSPSRDVGVEIQSSRIVKQQERERKLLEEQEMARSKSPGAKKGLSGLVKRLRFGKVRRTKSTSSVPPPKRLTGSYSNKAVGTKTNNNERTSTTNAPATKARGNSVPPSAKVPVLSTPTKDPPAYSSKSSALPASPAAGFEEEKKEIEGYDARVREEERDTEPTTPTPAASEPVRNEDKATERRPSHPEIKGLSTKPVVPIKASNSFGDTAHRESAAEEKPKPSKPPAPLEQQVPLNRLRSAPVRLSSSEALEKGDKDVRKKDKTILEEEPGRGHESGPDDEAQAVLDDDDGLNAVESMRKKAPKLTWKAATDGQGRTYYYHRETRKTTWVKPKEFDAEVAAVKKYKEEMEAVKKEAETQQVIDGYKSVEAIQNKLRKKTQRDFDPEVWQTKQEILDIVQTMPLPQGTNIERLLVQYDGREDQLLANLRDLVESKPFDEPFQAPRSRNKQQEPPNEQPTQSDHPTMIDSNALNISHTSSISVNSSANLNAVDVQHRVRTAVSASTRISEKTSITEKTEKVRNTSEHPEEGVEQIQKGFKAGAISTGSISSASAAAIPPRSESVGIPPSGRVPSKIPAVPRSRELKVEEFANDRIAKETLNGDVVPTPAGTSNPPSSDVSDRDGANRSETLAAKGGPPPVEAQGGSPKVVAEQLVAMSSLDDDDDDSYNGDYEATEDDRGTDTASEKIADSISALSEADVDYQAQKENFERARRRALDVAVEREDWDLAAALSEGMKQVKESLYGKPQQREWTQTELDRFISENDWDAVSKYIAHMRDHPRSSTASNGVSPISVPRGRDPANGGRDPDGYSQPPSGRIPVPGPIMGSGPPAYVSEATKRASTHTKSGRRQQQQERIRRSSAAGSASSSQGSAKRAQTRFGARSQLQHSDLNSISSWTNSSPSSSSCDSEYTDQSYESEDEHGYISLRVRRNEFEC